MKIHKHSKNVHQIDVEGNRFRLAVLSDIHWDNPKCDRDQLKRHLDYCLKNSIPILGVGDWQCLMQGRGDRRGNKSDIRPEHNNSRYLDSVVETMVDYFSPYAHLITVVGYGNHETAIIRHQETDVLARFVDLMNYKNGTQIQIGGYGGWLMVRMHYKKSQHATINIKYFHGSGGASPVTQGAINLSRLLAQVEDADIITMGHIHYNMARTSVREHLKVSRKGNFINQKYIHMMVTGTYKDEWDGGASGWAVEKGMNIKPIGGRILEMNIRRDKKNNQDLVIKHVDSTNFPLL